MEVFRKELDWSLFIDGIHIPLDVQDRLFGCLGFDLKRGESRSVQVFFNNSQFSAVLKSMPMNSDPSHSDMVHLRYSRNSKLAMELRRVYRDQFEYLKHLRALSKPRSHVLLNNTLYREITVSAEKGLILLR